MASVVVADRKSATYTQDPYVSFNFAIEIDGIQEGFFTECTGLQVEREVVEYKEGGHNEFVHKFAGPFKYSNIVLKKGYTTSTKLMDWFKVGYLTSKVQKKNVTIVLFDQTGSEALKKRFELKNAYPIKWTGPSFKSSDSGVMVETLEIAHNGWL
jgi:phage tail-like protein